MLFASVPATSQVIVSVLPTVQEIPLMFCEVTSKGPAISLTITAIISESVWPSPTTLSLTVNSKFIILETLGKTSQVDEVLPEITVGKAGIYLFVVSVGETERKTAPTVWVEEGGICIPITSLSICSQQ